MIEFVIMFAVGFALGWLTYRYYVRKKYNPLIDALLHKNRESHRSATYWEDEALKYARNAEYHRRKAGA